MAASGPVVLFAPDDAATGAIGRVLAEILAPGDLVALEGGLGAGKTALARAIVRALCADPDLEVPSPTFAILQPYPGVIHADLYRLSDESELEELGLFEDEDAVVLVEWPDRAPSLLVRPGLTITLDIGPRGRGRRIAIAVRDGTARPGLARALARLADTFDTGNDG